MCPKEVHEAGEGSRREAIWGATEVTWLIQSGEEELIAVYNFLTTASEGAGTDLLSGDRTWENSLKLCQERFRLNNRKRFFTQRVIGHWYRPPREVVTVLAQQSSGRVWIKFLETWCNPWDCPMQGQELVSTLWVPSTSGYSTLLW